MEKTTPKLELRDLHIVYRSQGGDDVEAVRCLNLEVADKPGVGEIVVFLGPSGCGKSTILKAVAGLLPPTQGQVLVDGVPVTGIGRDRGMVFQAYTSFGWLTVQQNVEYGLELQGIPKHERTAQAEQYLEAVGLKDSARKYPKELSGGMKQRVAIARTLINKPRLLLMDEPFGALDEIVRDMINQQLLRLWDKTRKTVLFVTHSIPEAVFLSTRIVVMSPRPGRIYDIIETGFPRQRPLDIRETPEFLEVANRVRHGLRAGHSYDD